MTSGITALEAHLASGRFRAGAAKGRWNLLELQWPFAFIDVLTRDGRRVVLRFDCMGYPEMAPSATVWDRAARCQLAAASWPRGGRVSQVFNPGWKGGAALYIPCDRESIPGHSQWAGEHPWLMWCPARGLLQYIEAVSEILQSSELVDEAA